MLNKSCCALLLIAVFLVVSQVSADHSPDRKKHHAHRGTTVRMAAGLLGDELKECRTDAECSNVTNRRVGPMTNCIATRVCFPPDTPDFSDEPPGSCVKHEDCGRSYMCLRNQCIFYGPRGCSSENDCPKGSPFTYECVERAMSAPGTKCYRKCTTDSECLSILNLCDGTDCSPVEDYKSNYGCCQVCAVTGQT